MFNRQEIKGFNMTNDDLSHLFPWPIQSHITDRDLLQLCRRLCSLFKLPMWNLLSFSWCSGGA